MHDAEILIQVLILGLANGALFALIVCILVATATSL